MENEFEYIVNYGKKVSITKWNGPKKFDGVITVPNEIGGLPVTRIGEGAFARRYHISGVILPNSIATIANHAFYNCWKLTSVKGAAGLTGIGHSAFFGCKLLTDISLPDTVTYIGHRAFSGCEGLSNLSFSEKLTKLLNCNVLVIANI